MPKLFQRVSTRARQESFEPGILGVFISPFFFIRRGLFKHIKRNAPHLTGVLLDFGCGKKPYRNLFTVEKYIGVDIEESGHPHETSKIDVYYDGKSIPFADGFFDSVLCSEVIEHVFEIDVVLDEINRVMKTRGKILITVPFAWSEHEVPYDYARYSTYGIKYLLEKHGFNVISIDKSTNFVEAVFQLWALYLHNLVKTKSMVFNAALNVILVAPFTVVGLVASSILPKRSDFFHNSVVLAEKK